MKGVKIRVPQAPMNIKLFQAFGAKPIALPFTEALGGLRSGAIDAQENPLDNVIDFKLWELQKYVAMTEHQRQAIIVVVSEKAYQKLPDDIKQAMQNAAKVAQAHAYSRYKEEEKEYKKKIEEKGMTFTYPDQGEFRKAASTTLQDAPPNLKELIKIVKELE
jgi:TRAP-type C4-dicarboxylate transport system substrate-binding protein